MQECVIFPNEWLLCCSRPPSVIYINICMWTDLFISLHPPPEVQLVEEEWVGGVEGGTCHHSVAVLQCEAVQNCHSEPKIHLAWEDKGGRKKDGDMRRGKRTIEEEGCGGMQRWLESVVMQSVLYCALLSPLLGIILSMNISLITAEKAERSWVEDACHTAPSAPSHHPPTPPLPCHTAPCLQLSTYPQCSLFPHPFFQLFSPYPSPALFSYPHLCSISPPFHLTLSPSFVLHVCVTVSFVSFPSLHLRPSLPSFSACTGWMETFCLLQRILFLPYWPTNRKESQAEMSLGCLFFWLPAMSACQARVCVCVLVWVCVHMCVWVHMCECVAHGLLSSQTEGLLWHVTQLYHTGGQNHLIRSTLTQIWIPNMDSKYGFKCLVLIGGKVQWMA